MGSKRLTCLKFKCVNNMRPELHTGVLRLQSNCKGTSVYCNFTNNVITQKTTCLLLMKLCYSATPSHWSLYCKYSVNNVSLFHTLSLWSSVILLYILRSSVMTPCSLAGMYQPQYTVSIQKNTSFYLVHRAST
jgi:hypothetical protein